VEDTRDTVAEHFRNAIHREQLVIHVVDRYALQPAAKVALGLARKLASMHRGLINAYVAYVLLALLIALAVGLL
jgi:hypothetical protein